MVNISLVRSIVIIGMSCFLNSFDGKAQVGLKDAVGKYALIGASVNQWQSDGSDAAATAVIRQHFNTAVAENCMKAEVVQPKEGKFRFGLADEFVKYCEDNHLTPIGHCLVWHSQAPKWFFTDSVGKTVSREVMIDRMKRHITKVVSRYKGRIHGWDVVNEAIEDDGSFRKSPFYNIIGEDFIEIAFRTAHEADPDVELYYNDYSMSNPAKRETVCRLVKRLKEKGLRIDAIGMQSHNGMNYPDLSEYEKSIEAFAACGVKVMITELDLNVLPNPDNFGGAAVEQNFEYQEKMNPYKNGLPEDKAEEIRNRYMDFFKIYYKHREKISRINLWGISDKNSWLNDWPIQGRTSYPLLFDRDYQPKPVVDDIINLYKN